MEPVTLEAPGGLDRDDVRAALIASALELLAEGGRGEFSLRRVAERIGAAGSAASHRFGDRAGLVAAVSEAALKREAAELARFAGSLPSLPAAVDVVAPVLIEWLDQRARWSRTQARTACELVLMSFRDPAAEAYAGGLRRLYLDFMGRLWPELSAASRDLLALYIVAEAPYWLILADDSRFKLLSGETARRASAFALGLPDQTPSFWVDQAAMEAARRELPFARPPILSGTKARIAAAVAGLIRDQGAHAVTHRAIAKAAEVSLSSLVHHFGRRGDLIRAGVQVLFGEVLAAGATCPVAAFELALYALSDPYLAPLSATVRRQLGTGSGADGRGLRELESLLGGAATLLGAENGPGARALRGISRTEADGWPRR